MGGRRHKANAAFGGLFCVIDLSIFGVESHGTLVVLGGKGVHKGVSRTSVIT